jgi:hypothetical protein
MVGLQVHLHCSAVHCRMRQMPAVEVLLVSMKVSCRDGEGGPFWMAREDETEGRRLATTRRKGGGGGEDW